VRTFDGNLDAYHTLNDLNDMYVRRISQRLAMAKTREESNAIMREADAHFAEQRKQYRKLGEEMVQIMGKKWWHFWK